MKKFCKSFLCTILFASVFALVSCGNISDNTATNGGGGNTPSPSSSNSVKFTLPSKNARSASAGSAGDVDYYNVYINRQSFENAQPGTEIKSAPIVVGTQVTVTVEAYGQAKDETGATVMQNSRIAYYTTTLSMPSSPVSLNIKMSEYKTVWHKVTLEAIQFDRDTEEEYVADGSSFTLPDYGTYTPFVGSSGGVPLKHIAWRVLIPGVDNPPSYPVGSSVPITGDTQFELVSEEFATLTFVDTSNEFINGSPVTWKSTDYAEKGKEYTLTSDYGTVVRVSQSLAPSDAYKHIGWSYQTEPNNQSSKKTVGINAKVLVTGDMTFTLEYLTGVQISGGFDSGSYEIELNSSIYKYNDSNYFIWDKQPFTLPRRKKADGSYENVEWTFSKYDSANYTSIESQTTWRSGVTVPFEVWDEWALQVCSYRAMSIAVKE